MKFKDFWNVGWFVKLPKIVNGDFKSYFDSLQINYFTLFYLTWTSAAIHEENLPFCRTGSHMNSITNCCNVELEGEVGGGGKGLLGEEKVGRIFQGIRDEGRQGSGGGGREVPICLSGSNSTSRIRSRNCRFTRRLRIHSNSSTIHPQLAHALPTWIRSPTVVTGTSGIVAKKGPCVLRAASILAIWLRRIGTHPRFCWAICERKIPKGSSRPSRNNWIASN